MSRAHVWRLLGLILFGLSSTARASGTAERIVVIKADGLPFDIVDRLVRQSDPHTGRSVLPWIEHVFYRGGTYLSNFYCRGLSVSAPSWAVLDTGQSSTIKGNAEFDRLSLDTYDYLNVVPLVIRNSTGRAGNTPAIEVLDDLGVPLLSDAYAPDERHLSLQILARNLKPISLVGSLKRLITLNNPKGWFDEWMIGLDGRAIMFEVVERDLIAKLKNPGIRYLDLLVPVFDHAAHASREPEAQIHAVREIDGIVKRIWSAIQETPMAERTALVLVSDHGMNSDAGVYSQGFNLIDLFGSASGGGHHVLTTRPPQAAYGFKALSPTVPLIVTSSSASYYLKGQSSDYPTLALDADGNERASVYFRQSDLNILHILLQQLSKPDLSAQLRSAAIQAFLTTIDRNRSVWNLLSADLQTEIAAFRRRAPGARADSYDAFIGTLNNLLAIRSEESDSFHYKSSDLIAKRHFGAPNSINDLQNYVIGLEPSGLVLGQDGALDMTRSFSRLNYFALLHGIQVRNNVQTTVSSRPVDFIAVGVPPELLAVELPATILPVSNAVWLYKGEETQALILAREDANGRVELRYLPIRSLTQDENGKLHFSRAEWRDDLPLRVWRDLPLQEEQRREWLDAWHTDEEWLDVFHESEYSNAVVSLHEQFSSRPLNVNAVTDEQLVDRFQQRKRLNARADFILFANDHWNFDFRGFNPGGNHGGFFRASTHATLMISGGNDTGIPRGLRVDKPYDALSYAPTILRLAGREGAAGSMPGPVIREMFFER
jgi:hypothetical protein